MPLSPRERAVQPSMLSARLAMIVAVCVLAACTVVVSLDGLTGGEFVAPVQDASTTDVKLEATKDSPITNPDTAGCPSVWKDPPALGNGTTNVLLAEFGRPMIIDSAGIWVTGYLKAEQKGWVGLYDPCLGTRLRYGTIELPATIPHAVAATSSWVHAVGTTASDSGPLASHVFLNPGNLSYEDYVGVTASEGTSGFYDIAGVEGTNETWKVGSDKEDAGWAPLLFCSSSNTLGKPQKITGWPDGGARGSSILVSDDKIAVAYDHLQSSYKNVSYVGLLKRTGDCSGSYQWTKTIPREGSTTLTMARDSDSLCVGGYVESSEGEIAWYWRLADNESEETVGGPWGLVGYDTRITAIGVGPQKIWLLGAAKPKDADSGLGFNWYLLEYVRPFSPQEAPRSQKQLPFALSDWAAMAVSPTTGELFFAVKTANGLPRLLKCPATGECL